MKQTSTLIFCLSFGFLSCNPPQQTGLQARPADAEQLSCENSSTAEELKIAEKKQELWEAIRKSTKYTSNKSREEALESYKQQIANLENSYCLEDLAKEIEKRINLQ